MPEVRDLVGNDQMVLGIDRRLYVVTDHARTATAGGVRRDKAAFPSG
jgi:hypothetical protein